MPSSHLIDQLNRPLRDLRISVTDRCNFRCTYCMPQEVFGKDFAFLERTELLRFEEIVLVARVARRLGVSKVRLTGGEPLLRRGVSDVVAMLAGIPGLELTLTTNGALLARHARRLKEAGLHRLTVSLDSLDDDVFRAMNDVDVPVAQVLAGISAAEDAGFTSIKINAVVKRGVNDGSVLPMARYFKARGHTVRFIEYMDVGMSNRWCLDHVVPASEIVDRIDREFPLEPVPPGYPGEVATRFRYRDGSGEVGVIASVTRPFCGTCTRARLSADGQLYTCLFATAGSDVRALLRGGASESEIEAALVAVWLERDDRYSELRGSVTPQARKIEMSYIGG